MGVGGAYLFPSKLEGKNNKNTLLQNICTL
jgi:hypothetical protein